MKDKALESKPMPVLYSTDDVCKMFHISRLTCLNLFRRNDFPAQKFGRAYKVEANALNEYLSKRHLLA